MKYKEIKIYTDDPSELAEKLSCLGYEQLVISDPADVSFLENESWGYTGSYVDRAFIDELKSKSFITFYLGENEALNNDALELIKDYEYSIAVVDDEDWLHKWEEYYVPFEIADGIVVKPVFRDYEPKGNETVIEIDPGMAFGTGSSPTTYLAARLLVKYMKPGLEVLDVGCGTGIQSIIAAKLGVKHILAVDYDPEAVKSTCINADLNKVTNIDIKRNDLVKGLDYKADLIAANLTGPLIIELCKDVDHVCKQGTVLIASGIIEEMEVPCKDALLAAGFDINEVIRDDCWVAIAAGK